MKYIAFIFRDRCNLVVNVHLSSNIIMRRSKQLPAAVASRTTYRGSSVRANSQSCITLVRALHASWYKAETLGVVAAGGGLADLAAAEWLCSLRTYKV